MSALFSPRDLAHALGVSESSLKRWIDGGRIRASRTEGGHRRVSRDDALAFIRETNMPVARPELLGLPEVSAASGSGSLDDDALTRALIDGDARAVHARISAHRRAGVNLAALCDGPLSRAMHTVGELWRHDPDGVVIEHRATDVCAQAIASLRAGLAEPGDGPVALGGAPEDDPYLVSSAMAALVVAAEGFRTFNLGADTPTQALHRAVVRHRPALVWISASAPLGVAHAHELAAFVVGLPAEITAVVGGRHAAAIAQADARVRTASSMTELAALARAVRAARG